MQLLALTAKNSQYIYKGILASRSSVFAAMFEHDMEERKQNKVKITDVDHKVVQEMLTYIYTDTSPNLKDMADDLLIVANKYDLERLKFMCEEFLCSKITRENAVSMLILADQHNADCLKAYAINFISANASYFLTTPSIWEKSISLLSGSPLLIVEVNRAIFASKESV